MRALRSVKQRSAKPDHAVQEARRRADDAYRRWACIHRELKAARLLPADGPNAGPDVQARIARLEAEEERLFVEAGEVWRAYTRAQCAALWNSPGKPLLPRGWLDTLRRALRALRKAVATPKRPPRRESRAAVQGIGSNRNVRHGGARPSRDLKSIEGAPR